MIQYFKEVLATLQQIEKHLAKIAGCVDKTRHGYSPALRINDDNHG